MRSQPGARLYLLSSCVISAGKTVAGGGRRLVSDEAKTIVKDLSAQLEWSFKRRYLSKPRQLFRLWQLWLWRFSHRRCLIPAYWPAALSIYISPSRYKRTIRFSRLGEPERSRVLSLISSSNRLAVSQSLNSDVMRAMPPI